MLKIYRDEIFRFNQFDLREDGDIFQTILDERKDKRDSQRFFLEKLIKFYETGDNKDLKQWIYDTSIDGIDLNKTN